jgi:hypothetical protein
MGFPGLFCDVSGKIGYKLLDRLQVNGIFSPKVEDYLSFRAFGLLIVIIMTELEILNWTVGFCFRFGSS